MKAAIVIPVYKTEISKYEAISLDNLRNLLGDYDTFFVKQHSLTAPYIVPNDAFICFDEHYFTSVDGYNSLLTSVDFYKAFSSYDYVLITQLDTFVFKDELKEWCRKGYAYIGAPWMFELSTYAHLNKYLPCVHRSAKLKTLRKFTSREYLVGNGGFSLRNVGSFTNFLEAHKRKLEEYKDLMLAWKTRGIDVAFNEDAFWALFVPTIQKDFGIAPFKEALQFAFEVDPRYCFERNGHKLPFGCHAWEKHGMDFWKPILKKYGYEI